MHTKHITRASVISVLSRIIIIITLFPWWAMRILITCKRGRTVT